MIHLYGTIGFGDKTAQWLAGEMDKEGDDIIEVAINSGGGDLFEGLAMTTRLKEDERAVSITVDGLAASAAALPIAAADEVRMYESAFLMIHNPWSIADGDHNDLKKAAGELEEMANSYADEIMNRFNGERDELISMLDDETWLTARDAKEMGLVDTIIDDEDATDEPATAAAKVVFASSLDFATLPTDVAKAMQNASSQNTTVNIEEPMEAQVDDQKGKEQAHPEPQEAAKKERRRIMTIQRAAKRMGLSENDQVAAMIDGGESVSAALEKMLDLNAEDRPAIQSTSDVQVGKDEMDNFKEGITKNFAAQEMGTKQDPKNPYRGATILTGAQKWLALNGEDALGISKSEVAERVFRASAGRHSTSDYPNILKDAANVVMEQIYEESPHTWEAWTENRPFTDFRVHHRQNINQFQTFEKTPESGEIKYGTIGDRGQEARLESYSNGFKITRQTIINDQLSALMETPRMMAEAAGRTIQFAVSSLLSKNDQTIDRTGRVIFHNTDNNLIDQALTSSALSDAIAAMRNQRDEDGKGALNFMPRYLLVPAELEADARRLTGSIADVDENQSGIMNVHQAAYEVIVDPNLGFDDLNGDPAHWYLAAQRSGVQVGGLNGAPAPRMEVESATLRGMKIEAILDFGVVCVENRSLVKSTGG